MGCEGDDPREGIENGAFIRLEEFLSSGINVEDASQEFEFVLTDPAGNVSAWNLSATWFAPEGDSTYQIGPIPILTVEEFPATIGISGSELAGFFNVPFDSISAGDRFVFNATTEDGSGRVWTVNDLSPDLEANAGQAAGFQFEQFAFCPTDVDLITGVYRSVITSSSFGGFIGSTNNEVTITFAGPEPFRYRFSDISSLAYTPFGGAAYSASVFDICGTAIMQNTTTFGTTVDTGGGEFNVAEDGTITLNAFEQNNGISWTVVFTKLRD